MKSRARLSVLIVTDPQTQPSADALAIAQALGDSGALVLGVRQGDALLPEVVARLKPDVIVVRSDAAVRDVLEHIAVATQHARKPIALFTDVDDRPTMRAALRSGVSAYVVKGLSRERVQSVIDVAVERFAADEALREEVLTTRTALKQRDAVTQAKRLVMRRKGLSEPEAHKFLQGFAMQRSLKLHDAARQLLDFESLWS